MSNNFMSMASIAVTDQDKNLQPEGVSVVGMPPVTVNPVGVPVNMGAKKRKLPEDPNGNQISVCGLHLDQLLCNNTKYTVFDLCELCLDEGVRCRIGKHPNMSSSSMSMMPTFAAEETALKHYTPKGKKKNLPSGYRFFFVDQRDLLLQSHPQLTFAEMSPIISKSWAKVDEGEKMRYKKLADAKRTEMIQQAIQAQGKKVRMVSAFQFYTKDQRIIMKEVNPSMSFAELSTAISKSWGNEDEAVKAKYRKMADDANMAAKANNRA